MTMSMEGYKITLPFVAFLFNFPQDHQYGTCAYLLDLIKGFGEKPEVLYRYPFGETS